MKTFQWIVGTVAAGAFLTGCQTPPRATLPQAQALPQALSQIANLGQSATTAQKFPRPLIVGQKPGSPAPKPAGLPLGLIQATNPQVRAAIAPRGRRDPFALIPVAPIALTATSSQPLGSVSSLPPAPVPAGPSAITTIPIPQTLPSVGVVPLPPAPTAGTQLPSLPTVAVAPPSAPASRTHLADAIQVTGVIQTRGQLSAIIQSPADGAGRYVVAGDYLANGRVLVKRIEARPGSEPIVVFEQNGIQVRKAVGSPLASAR